MWKLFAGGVAGFGAACLASHFTAAQSTVFAPGGYAISGVAIAAVLVGALVYSKTK